LPAWVDAHRRMLDAFGGSTAIWVPDNLKSGITTPNRYEPEVNRTYAELAQHYGARSQLLSPLSDNYFCRRRVSKGSAAGDRSGTR
jgi:transposase